MADPTSGRDAPGTRPGRVPDTLRTCLRHAESVLDQAEIEGYDVEARLLCEWVTGRSKLDFIARPDEPIHPKAVQTLDSALEKRISGMPVHRIIGFREFYGLRLNLSEATLEPRPDTETLVDQVIDIIRQKRESEASIRLLDLGTGTGAIALALLSMWPNAYALGVDVSSQALETAEKNASLNGLSARFGALQSNWFDKVSGKFDLIVSNPPYIRTETISQLDIEVRAHDPLIALDGGPDGLAPYHDIESNAVHHLVPDGIVCVEIGHDQAIDVKEIFSENRYEFIELRKDLGGRDRALAFTLKYK